MVLSTASGLMENLGSSILQKDQKYKIFIAMAIFYLEVSPPKTISWSIVSEIVDADPILTA